MSGNEVIITEVYVTEVYAKMDTFVVRLEKDPTVMGPSYVHSKLKECRDHSNSVEKFLIQFYDMERKLRNSLSGAKAVYDAQRSELLAVDPDVLKRRSATDREAYTNYKLKTELECITDLKEQLTTCQYVLKAIELKKDGLNRVNNDIKKQVALMEFVKGNSAPINGDYEGENLSFGADDDTEDLSSILGTPPSTPADEGLTDGAAPDEITPYLQKHMTTDEPDPSKDLVSESDDLDSFLDNLTTEVTDPAPEVEASIDDDDDVVASLFAAPLDEKKSASPQQTDDSQSDDDALDIGKFLSQNQ